MPKPAAQTTLEPLTYIKCDLAKRLIYRKLQKIPIRFTFVDICAVRSYVSVHFMQYSIVKVPCEGFNLYLQENSKGSTVAPHFSMLDKNKLHCRTNLFLIPHLPALRFLNINRVAVRELHGSW